MSYNNKCSKQTTTKTNKKTIERGKNNEIN